MKMKTMKLRDLETSSSNSVFVLNKTKGSTRGQVIFNAPRVGGGADTVIVPPTFIPVELTEQVSKEQLMTSPDFRKAVAREMIVIVDDESARQYLATSEAQDEIVRLRNAESFYRNAMVATKVDETEVVTLRDPANNAEEETQEDDGSKINGISAGIVHAMELLADSGDEKGTLATIRSLGELDAKEYRYVFEHAPENCGDLINWARREYNEIKGH